MSAPVNCPSSCACECHGEKDDPGPDHLPTCLWAGPNFGDDFLSDAFSDDSSCPTCLDHGIYGDVDETTGDVVDTYCACLHGQARRARDEQ